MSPQSPSTILIRLPNWLGDVVMATGFIGLLQKKYPDAIIDVIVKKELQDIVKHISGITSSYPFSKKEYSGILGLYRFGRMVKKQKKYDLFFSLPDSFSSALLGAFTGSKVRIGYKAEFRNLLLTSAIKKPLGLHRAIEYAHLINQAFAPVMTPFIRLQVIPQVFLIKLPEHQYLVVNINSEAASRRLPLKKAQEIISKLLQIYNYQIVLTGSKKEEGYVGQLATIVSHQRLINIAGKTNLSQLIYLLSKAAAVVSTDSGIAHVANAVGTKVVALFGAGDESKTAPFNAEKLKLLRNKNVSCHKCVSNTCQYGQPKCLEELDTKTIYYGLNDLNV